MRGMSVQKLVGTGDHLVSRIQDRLKRLPDFVKGCLSCCLMAPVMAVVGTITLIEVAFEKRHA